MNTTGKHNIINQIYWANSHSQIDVAPWMILIKRMIIIKA